VNCIAEVVQNIVFDTRPKLFVVGLFSKIWSRGSVFLSFWSCSTLRQAWNLICLLWENV